jgi:hypothetical protein
LVSCTCHTAQEPAPSSRRGGPVDWLAAEALEARDLLFFRYIEQEKVVLALDARLFGPVAPLVKGPVLEALPALAERKDVPGEDFVLVSESINNIVETSPVRSIFHRRALGA